MSTFSNLLYHIVYSTKYRKPAIRPNLQEDLYSYIGGIIRAQKGTLLKIGGMEDHIHLLAKLSPTIAISDGIRLIKTNSSKWMNEHQKATKKFAWQSGFAAFSVSESQVNVVSDYIANQYEHHRKKTFEEEFLSLLRKHRIEPDSRYVFDREIGT
ncbi:MAG: IS200/IS605 family transposase [Planctomycetota bacterium]